LTPAAEDAILTNIPPGQRPLAAGPFHETGDRLGGGQAARHFFGDPAHWGVCDQGKIMVPLFQREFAAFVLLKQAE